MEKRVKKEKENKKEDEFLPSPKPKHEGQNYL